MIFQLPDELLKRLLVLCEALNPLSQLVNCHLILSMQLLECLILAACTSAALLLMEALNGLQVIKVLDALAPAHTFSSSKPFKNSHSPFSFSQRHGCLCNKASKMAVKVKSTLQLEVEGANACEINFLLVEIPHLGPQLPRQRVCAGLKLSQEGRRYGDVIAPALASRACNATGLMQVKIDFSLVLCQGILVESCFPFLYICQCCRPRILIDSKSLIDSAAGMRVPAFGRVKGGFYDIT